MCLKHVSDDSKTIYEKKFRKKNLYLENFSTSKVELPWDMPHFENFEVEIFQRKKFFGRIFFLS